MSVTNRARNLKLGILVGNCRYYSTMQNFVPLRCVWGDQQLPLFLSLEPPHISETNGARKLKFGTLVCICRYYDYM